MGGGGGKGRLYSLRDCGHFPFSAHKFRLKILGKML